MKEFFKLISLIFIFNFIECQNFVTYSLSSGRLGDQLVSYCHARWISYKYGFCFLYKPFPYSDKLLMHVKDVSYNSISKQKLNYKILKAKQPLNDFIKDNDKNTLYVIPYFPESLEEYQPIDFPLNKSSRIINQFPYFKVNWKNKEFKKLISSSIKPKYHIKLIKPDKNKINIAIHVRRNSGGYDSSALHNSKEPYNPKIKYMDILFPLKHPPIEYYFEQLQNLVNQFSDQEVYVYIFTDDPNPLSIVNEFKKHVFHKNLIFDFRLSKNNHYSNVLEDLFSMIEFDYLIRADSNLSIIASKIGNFQQVISPAHHLWEETYLIIDKVNIEEN